MVECDLPAVVVSAANLADPVHQCAIVELLDDYACDSMGVDRALSADVRRRLIPALRAHPAIYVLLAWDGDQAIGVAVCFLGFSTFTAKPLLNIHDLAVHSGLRERGVGRLLLASVTDVARDLGCCKVTLEVREDNERARHLYAAMGFSPVHMNDAPLLFLSKPLDDIDARSG